MITGTHVIGASLIGLLVDRLVLERRLGSTPFSRPSTKLSRTFGSALPVLIVLTISAAATSLLVTFFLQLVSAAFLYPLVFAGFIVITALGGELLLPKWQSPEVRNRVSGRTMVVAVILGFLVLIPQGCAGCVDALSCAKNVLDASIAGAIFFIVVIVWNGIREKIDLAAGTDKPLSAAQELLAAGLMALALLSISGLSFFHG
jgi:Na+-translocating ferredoxin:NAD+ oxidoreductase subunit A